MKEVDPILVDVAKLLGYRPGLSFEFPVELDKLYKFNVNLIVTKIDLEKRVVTFNSSIDRE